jgi:hypothetical protein
MGWPEGPPHPGAPFAEAAIGRRSSNSGQSNAPPGISEEQLVEKLRRIEALFARAGSVGERLARESARGAHFRFIDRVCHKVGVDVALSAIDAFVAGDNRDCSAAAFSADHRPSSETAWAV